MNPQTEQFREARDLLINLREDYDAACEQFSWPRFENFNFALDWFDQIAQGNDNPALWIVEEDGAEGKWSYQELSEWEVRRGRHPM